MHFAILSKRKCYFTKSISLPLTFNEGKLAEFSVGGLLLNDIGDKFSQVYYYTTADSKAVLSWDAQPELEAYKCYVDGEHSFKYEPEAAAGHYLPTDASYERSFEIGGGRRENDENS